MVGFAQLRDARLDELDSAWRVWRRLVIKLEEAEDTYRDKLLQPVRNSRWQGAAAQTALAKLVLVQHKIRICAAEASNIASVINTGYSKFKAAQDQLKQAIHDADAMYLKVGTGGSLHFPEALPAGYVEWRHYRNDAQRIQQRFVDAVKQARDADTQIAGALRDLGPDVLDSADPLVELRKDAQLATKMAGFDADNIPPKNLQNPRVIAAWWKSLPEEQRHLLMNAYPEKIGWIDGLPAEDRNEANRVHLANRVDELENKQPNLSTYEQRDLDRLHKLNNALADYERHGRDVYLLGLREGPADHPRDPVPKLDNPGAMKDGPDGQAIVAFGNPDTAKHTAVYVPGTTENLDGFTGAMGRSARLWDQSNIYAPGEVSTVAWLGYDAPDRVSADATKDSYAEQGGRALDGFINGVNSAQQVAGQSDSHITAIGHSYGSTVIGEGAKHGNGLAVDDIVVAGSPGMHVSKASDLHVGEHHVWSETAWNDPVAGSGAWVHGGKTMDWRNGHPVFGPVTPTSADFGGNAMTVDTSGHSGYWDESSESLKNQAKVIAQQYGGIGLERGRTPS